MNPAAIVKQHLTEAIIPLDAFSSSRKVVIRNFPPTEEFWNFKKVRITKMTYTDYLLDKLNEQDTPLRNIEANFQADWERVLWVALSHDATTDLYTVTVTRSEVSEIETHRNIDIRRLTQFLEHTLGDYRLIPYPLNKKDLPEWIQKPGYSKTNPGTF